MNEINYVKIKKIFFLFLHLPSPSEILEIYKYIIIKKKLKLDYYYDKISM